MKLKWPIIYVCSIAVINAMFAVIPLIDLPTGDKFSFGSLFAGFVFILRDYAQRDVGHKVIGFTLIALAVSYYTSSPYIAAASGIAFLISELVDYAVYSLHSGSMRHRILISSAISVPIDSAAFLLLIGHFSATSFIAMCISKMVAVAVVWRFVK